MKIKNIIFVMMGTIIFSSLAHGTCKPKHISDGCTINPPLFPEIVIYAGFANNYGCTGNIYCSSDKWVSPEISPFSFLGKTKAWQEANLAAEKANVALQWIAQIIYPRNKVITDSSVEIFENWQRASFDQIKSDIPKIENPLITFKDNGVVDITVWVNTTNHNQYPVITYEKVILTVDAQGFIQEPIIQQQFSIDCWNENHICQLELN